MSWQQEAVRAAEAMLSDDHQRNYERRYILGGESLSRMEYNDRLTALGLPWSPDSNCGRCAGTGRDPDVYWYEDINCRRCGPA